MDEISQIIVEIFRTRSATFAGPSAVAEAQKAANDQRQNYQTYFHRIRDIRYRSSSSGDLEAFPHNHFVDAMEHWCAGVLLQKPPSIHQGEDETQVVRSPIPVLTFHQLSEQQLLVSQTLPASEALQLRNMLTVGPLIERAADIPLIDFESIAVKGRSEAIAAIAEYTAARSLYGFRPTLIGRVEQRMATQQALLDKLQNETTEEIAKHRVDLGALDILATDISGKITTLEEEKDSIRESLKGFEAAVRAEHGLDRTRETWSKRYAEARDSFTKTVYVLIGMLILPFVAAFVLGPYVVRFVNNFDIMVLLGAGGTGAVFAHFLTRLVIISVPVFAYLWALRVVIRYFTRSMMLKDDARMRETMLDTYFILTAAGRANESNSPIILNALFRPAPGHGTEGTEPPDVAAYLESLTRMTRPG
jgi:hypothetical protein